MTLPFQNFGYPVNTNPYWGQTPLGPWTTGYGYPTNFNACTPTGCWNALAYPNITNAFQAFTPTPFGTITPWNTPTSWGTNSWANTPNALWTIQQTLSALAQCLAYLGYTPTNNFNPHYANQIGMQFAPQNINQSAPWNTQQYPPGFAPGFAPGYAPGFNANSTNSPQNYNPNTAPQNQGWNNQPFHGGSAASNFHAQQNNPFPVAIDGSERPSNGRRPSGVNREAV